MDFPEPGTVLTLDRLEHDFPMVPWRRPIPVLIPGIGKALGCRICIAVLGFKGDEVEGLPTTEEEFSEHFRLAHAVEAEFSE